MLTDQQIIKFQTLYKNRFGKELNRQEAYEKGVKLLRLMEIIYKPMTQEEYQQLEERRKQTNN